MRIVGLHPLPFPTPPLRGVLQCALLLALVSVLLAPDRARAAPSPEHYRIGAFLTAIHHIDTAAGTFDADLWIWSVGASPTRDPLQTMEFINAETITRRLQSTTQRGGLFWRQVKVVGTFRQDWDLSSFPFDKQVLSIALEDGVDDATALVYDPDTANTGYAPQASPPGWRIMGLAIQAGINHYATNFGDPTAGYGSDYARLHLAITLRRVSLAPFLNLAAPLYAAFLLCAVTFVLHKDGWVLVESRLFLLASALFAVVLNMRTVSTILGNVHHLNVVDQLGDLHHGRRRRYARQRHSNAAMVRLRVLLGRRAVIRSHQCFPDHRRCQGVLRCGRCQVGGPGRTVAARLASSRSRQHGRQFPLIHQRDQLRVG